MIKDTPQKYGAVSRFLHWLMAFMVLAQFLKFGDRINDGEHWVGALVKSIHGSFGVIFMALVILRIVWALAQRDRPPYQGALAVFARLGHWALYACMVLMPLSGILRGVGKGRAVKVFGVEVWPASGVETPWMIAVGQWHSPVAWTLLVLVLGHVAMGVYHHVVQRDGTLARMTSS